MRAGPEGPFSERLCQAGIPHMMAEVFQEGKKQNEMASEVAHHTSLHILLVKASDKASPESRGGKRDSTS